jgi:hypothetical protein
VARTAVAPTVMVADSSVDTPAGTTIDATLVTNGVTITPTRRIEDLYLRVANTFGADKAVTIKAGTSTAALDSVKGDLAVTVQATSGSKLIGPLSSSRFEQPGGLLWVDFATGFTGTIAVIHQPRNT